MGGDALAIRVCEELLATHGHRAAVIWMHDAELGARLAALGERCRYVAGAPNDDEALRQAGAVEAESIMVLSDDDRLNLQGLRQIRTRGHVLVFGCGNVGTRVVELLRALNRHVVVVELKPDPMLEEMSSRRGIELVTGDATRDATLDLCNIPRAQAVIAVTDSDIANLEVALGVRARNKDVPLVMRVQTRRSRTPSNAISRRSTRSRPRRLPHRCSR